MNDENQAIEYEGEGVPWDEVAARLDCGKPRAKRAARLGQIPAVRVGSRFIVLRQPWEEFLKGNWKPRPQARRVS